MNHGYHDDNNTAIDAPQQQQPTTPFGTISILKGLSAYEHAARLLLEPGSAKESLAVVATARAGLGWVALAVAVVAALRVLISLVGVGHVNLL